MKKSIFLVLFALVMVSANAQEVIALGGYGYTQADSTHKGDYTFAEARLMFSLSETFRAGFYGGYVGYGNMVTNTSALRGAEWKYGLSMDSYGPLTYSHSYYFWTNAGIKHVNDQYQESYYKSKTLTNEMFVSGGLSVTDDWQGWFGHNQLMFDYQRPFGTPNISATWKGNVVTNNTPYNKESFRFTLESGVKRFGVVLNVEPIIHLGYGRDFGRDKNYYEFGGGLSFGVHRDWYREILKISVYKRTDFGETYTNINSTTPGSRLNIGVTFNASSAYQLLIKK